MATPIKRYRHQDYTVAWVCALPLEMAAAVAMLDERHRDLPPKQNDDNSYILGRVCAHNVVIACLPSGVYGTTSATTVAAQMRHSFESIRFFLMVGIGGGAPSKNDIRLGDVVVSKPTLNFGGVIQYDIGKALSDGRFERIGVLNKPPPVLLSAIATLQATQMPSPREIFAMVSKLATERRAQEQMFTYPGDNQDLLFDQGYDHPDPRETCGSCDVDRLIQRSPRNEYGPLIHYGLVASGNQVIKNSRTRDLLAQEYDVLCFEMEAAGLMDNFPCLGYAAATAASYAKVLLSVVQGRQVADTPSANLDLLSYAGSSAYQTNTPMDVIPRQYSDKELIEEISNYEHKKVHWRLSQKRLPGTTEWFLGHPIFKKWFVNKEVSIGSGKTMIALQLYFFYCDYEYNDELDASFMVSSLVKQLCEFLYQQFKYYPTDTISDLQKFFGPERIQPDFDDLQDIFSRLYRVVPDTIYIIDGIDTLQEAHASCFLKFIQRFFCSKDASQRSQVLLLSRDQVPGYINIGTFIHGICQISISTNAMQDIKNYIETSIDEKMMYRKLTDDVSLLNEIKETLFTESSNMFLWVYLQLEILWDTCRTDADIRYALNTLPRTIEETYKRCVYRTDFQDGWALKVLKWVSFAKRPLHIEELREAVAFQLTDTEWDANKKPQRDFIIGCCANLVVLDPLDNCVRFAHSSVKQYLAEDRKRAREERSVLGYPREINGDLECGELCVTYLSFSDFSLQLVKSSTQQIATIPSPYSIAQTSRNPTNSISLPVHTIRTPAAPSRAQYRFLDYAIANWALHTRQIQDGSQTWEKFVRLAMRANETWNFHPWVSGGRSNFSYLHGLFGWAVKERHKPLLLLVLGIKSSLQLIYNLPLVNEGLPALHIASKLGYEDIVQILLKFCNINSLDQEGCTPLHHAARNGHTDVARLLLHRQEIKYEVDAINHCTPLWLAASHGSVNIVSLLIHKGARIEVEDNVRHRTPLWRAIENEHYSTVECQDTVGQTPLDLAIAKRNKPIIDMLLNNRATYTSKDIGLVVEFMQWATENNFKASALRVMRRNANNNLKELLYLAVQQGYSAVVEMLLVGTSSSIDTKLLLWATENVHMEVIAQLVEKGTDPNTRVISREKSTPLHWAAKSSNAGIIRFFLGRGAKVNARDNHGETPLHYAASEQSYAPILKILLDNGADINTTNGKEAMKVLLESGADVDSKDNDGKTPWDMAQQRGFRKGMEILMENKERQTYFPPS
ncbi:putative ankyrin repeat-containing protein [Trichoderma austrokoningii]